MADMNLKLKIQGDSKSAEDSVGRVNAALRGLESSGAKLNGMLAGLGVSLSAGAFAAFVKSGIDAADALSKLSSRTGIAVESLAGLKLAAELSDTSLENVGAAINKLGINIAKNGDAFKQLGIDTKDPLEAFLQFADVFSSIEEPQQRAAVGAAALGRSYAELAPLLVQGSAALREQIAEGQSYNKVTQAQADAAAAFNDEITRLETRLNSFSINIAGPGVQAINAWIDALSFAKTVTDSFNPLAFLDAGGYAMGGKGGQVEYLNKQINETSSALEKLANRSVAGQIADAILGGNDYEKLSDRLVTLKKRRDELMSPAAQTTAANAPNQSAINNLLKITDESAKKSESAAKSAATANANRLKSVNAIIAGLQRDIEISKLSEDQQRKALELSNALTNARGAEVQTITDLIEAKYQQIEVDKRQSAQWQQLISDANDYYDLRKSIGELSDTNLTLDSFSGGLGQIQDQLNAGVINPDQAKALFDQLGQSYNTSFIEPAKTGTDQLSEYGVQAARNMQSAFAEFLFDPFNAETGGMVDNFLTAIRRMAAEAAAANLAELLFGGGPNMKDKNGVLREVVGWIGSAVGSYFGSAGSSGIDAFGANASGRIVSGVFANGGIMTDMGPLPLNKYALGGVANTPQLALFGEGRRPEAYVPLPDGRSIPVSMKDGGRQNVNYITMHISTPNADSFRKSERQIKQQMQRAINV